MIGNCYLTCKNSFSNLYAPPPVAHIVLAKVAIPFDFANARKFDISEVGNTMKWSEPTRSRIVTLSICKNQKSQALAKSCVRSPVPSFQTHPFIYFYYI